MFAVPRNGHLKFDLAVVAKEAPFTVLFDLNELRPEWPAPPSAFWNAFPPLLVVPFAVVDLVELTVKEVPYVSPASVGTQVVVAAATINTGPSANDRNVII